MDGEQDDGVAGAQTSLSDKSCVDVGENEDGYRSLMENTENPNRASSAHVTKLCHAPAVAIRRREGVGSVSRLPWDRATKNVEKTRWT